MLAQGVLDFQYESDSSRNGLTSLAGLAVYLDLVKASGLGAAIQRHVGVAGSQGWLDIQMVLAVALLNLAGGDCVDDIERLERDGGFSAILRAIEKDLLSRAHLNPIERLWGLMHKHLTHNKTYATYREFAEVALDFLRKKVPKCWPEFCNSVTDNFRVINPKDFRVLA